MPREVISTEDDWHIITEDGDHLVKESSSYVQRGKASTLGRGGFWRKYFYFYMRDRKKGWKR